MARCQCFGVVHTESAFFAFLMSCLMDVEEGYVPLPVRFGGPRPTVAGMECGKLLAAEYGCSLTWTKNEGFLLVDAPRGSEPVPAANTSRSEFDRAFGRVA